MVDGLAMRMAHVLAAGRDVRPRKHGDPGPSTGSASAGFAAIERGEGDPERIEHAVLEAVARHAAGRPRLDDLAFAAPSDGFARRVKLQRAGYGRRARHSCGALWWLW